MVQEVFWRMNSQTQNLQRKSIITVCETYYFIFNNNNKKVNKKDHWDSGTPPANKLRNVTSRLMSNITRKYIFTEYRSSITPNLNDLDFAHSR